MGADAHILIKADVVELGDPDVYLIEQLAIRRCGPGQVQLYRPDPDLWAGPGPCPDDVLVVQTPHRYYGVGYECGNWPRIRSILDALLKDAQGYPVLYGPDADGDDLPRVTPELLAELDAHWKAVGNADFPTV